jgi:hypothetical protein
VRTTVYSAVGHRSYARDNGAFDISLRFERRSQIDSPLLRESAQRGNGRAIGHRENGNVRMTNRARAKIGETQGQILCSNLLDCAQSTIPCQYFLYFRSIGIDNLEYYTLLYRIGVLSFIPRRSL